MKKTAKTKKNHTGLLGLMALTIFLFGFSSSDSAAQGLPRKEPLPNFVAVDAVLLGEPRRAFLPLLLTVEGMQDFVVAEYRIKKTDATFKVYYLKDAPKPLWPEARLSCLPLFGPGRWRWYPAQDRTYLFDPAGPAQNWLLFEFPLIVADSCKLITRFLQSAAYLRAIEQRRNPLKDYGSFYPALIGLLP